MGSRYLVLDIDGQGMHAAIWEKKWSGFTHTDNVYTAEIDLPDSPAEKGLWYRAALESLAGQMDLSSCSEALVLIPCKEVFFRNISLPFSSPGKIAQVLPFELSPYLPAEACVSDFIPLNIRFVQDQQLLLTASVPDTLVREITDTLHSFRIRTRIITPREIALAAACIQQPDQPADQLIICLGAAGTVLILMAGSRPVIIRTPSSSHQGLDSLADDMLRMATGFRHRSGLDTRFHICLVPETGTMNPDSVTQAIKQAQVLQPFFFTDTVTVLNSESSGLSDRLFQKPATQFNFVTRHHGPAAFFHKFRQELGVTGIIGALVMILFISGLYQDVRHLENQVGAARRTQQEIFQLTFPQDPVLPGLSPLLRMQARVGQDLQAQNSTRRQDMTDIPALWAIDVLYVLSTAVPDGMNLHLSRLLFNNGQVTVSGTTDSFNTVDRLKNALEKSNVFKTVTINTADAGRDENQIIFQFRIEI
jgi:general secretion pathway protein L